MKFHIKTDKKITVAFEPTAAEYELNAGEKILVEWFEGGDDGQVSLESDEFVIWAPGGGYTRAWNSNGVEIYIGPESGPESE
ncbi:hypothetical protein ACFWYW_56110 [Nonomuraea sp. NPDC059023]|uniref:hypothetical protein n=1 Tax=unclassified Nonomuraea TaxID=2593643 RepID=UPI003691C5CC